MIQYRKMEQHYSKQTINLWLCHYHELLSYMMCTLWHFYKLINYQNLCYHWLLESTNLFKSLAYFLFNLIANNQMCVYYWQRTSAPQKGYWSPPTNGDWVKFLSRKNGFGLPWIDLATLLVLVGGGGCLLCDLVCLLFHWGLKFWSTHSPLMKFCIRQWI